MRGNESKPNIITLLKNYLDKESFTKLETSGILDKWDYRSSIFDDVSARNIIQVYNYDHPNDKIKDYDK